MRKARELVEFQGISHIDLTVSDAKRSADWYERVLGLKKLKSAVMDGRIVEMLAHRPTRMIVGLVQHPQPQASHFDERVPGLDHLGFAVSSREELNQWQAHLENEGVEHSPITDAPSGSGTALVFRDPDNIQLEIWWTNTSKQRTSRKAFGADINE